MKTSRKFLGLTLAALLLFSSRLGSAENGNVDYEIILGSIYRYYKHGQYANANVAAKQSEGLSHCLLFLLAITDYANKRELNEINLKDINEKYRLYFNDCKTQKIESYLEKQLFGALAHDCEKNLEKINDKIAQRRKRPKLDKCLGSSLIGSGLASILAGAILAPASIFPHACYSFTNEDVPRPSDGKELQCVYPLNYKIGAPVLGAAGIGFIIAGGIEFHHARRAEKKNGDTNSEKIEAMCPQLPSLASGNPDPKDK